MIPDLVLAVIVTLASGTAFLQARHDALALLGAALSIAAGPLFLWRRGRKPIIPIAAIYCVLMFFALVILNFWIAAYRGQVDL